MPRPSGDENYSWSGYWERGDENSPNGPARWTVLGSQDEIGEVPMDFTAPGSPVDLYNKNRNPALQYGGAGPQWMWKWSDNEEDLGWQKTFNPNQWLLATERWRGNRLYGSNEDPDYVAMEQDQRKWWGDVGVKDLRRVRPDFGAMYDKAYGEHADQMLWNHFFGGANGGWSNMLGDRKIKNAIFPNKDLADRFQYAATHGSHFGVRGGPGYMQYNPGYENYSPDMYNSVGLALDEDGNPMPIGIYSTPNNSREWLANFATMLPVTLGTAVMTMGLGGAFPGVDMATGAYMAPGTTGLSLVNGLGLKDLPGWLTTGIDKAFHNVLTSAVQGKNPLDNPTKLVTPFLNGLDFGGGGSNVFSGVADATSSVPDSYWNMTADAGNTLTDVGGGMGDEFDFLGANDAAMDWGGGSDWGSSGWNGDWGGSYSNPFEFTNNQWGGAGSYTDPMGGGNVNLNTLGNNPLDSGGASPWWNMPTNTLTNPTSENNMDWIKGMLPNALKAGLQYFLMNNAKGQLDKIASTAASRQSALDQPQRSPFQAALNQMWANPSAFFSENPVIKAQVEYLTKQFKANAAKHGMGGTTVSAFNTDILNALSGNWDKFNNELATLGGYNQGPGGAGAVYGDLARAGVGTGVSGYNGIFQMLGDMIGKEQNKSGDNDLLATIIKNAISGAYRTPS